MTAAAPPPFLKVLDSGAMIAYLKNEPGGLEMDRILMDPAHTCMAHAVNLCEVFYEFLRHDGEAAALAALEALYDAGVQLREDLDPAFWQAVGRLKVSPGRIALADGFMIALAITLAQRTGGELVTGDHHELDRIAPLGLCPIYFFR